MIISSPEVKKTIDDYDIIFSTGIGVTYSLDKASGDSIELGHTAITISLVAKPSPNDPKMLLPAEDVTIFMAHVASVQHRERVVVDLTPAEKVEWHKTWQDLTRG